ncbi:hybrid sensor histidine kinase/response regulator [Neptunomonas phycophila]|uniref:hybrid sensor histidine kinase/response regulator n=1 Tax=Neptunomonas phycophila TaxID=1572645 RepID=UPI001BEB2C9E|nr:NahK/ErcS family hybrid sensor histidine kinase/response regulator [Neptunomonas phycophila]MBT3144372.1 PAS-domain containing protein [Neptunomonas phycophila]
MLSGWFIILVSLLYVGLLFGIAYYGDSTQKGKSYASNPVVYSLSLAVYCSSWTFYGAVGRATYSGWEFMATYIGPILVYALGWRVVEKMILISKQQNTTTISDFISSRYGKSQSLAVLVTLIAVCGTLPYIAMQLKAVAISFNALTPGATEALSKGSDTALFVAILMAIFAILFGTRHIDATEHHEGMVLAVAFESIVKLTVFIAVGLFVSINVFDGFGDTLYQITQALHSERKYQSFLGGSFLTEILLACIAILCLPRQFHVAVVENTDIRNLRVARWIFPLYMLVIGIFVLPISTAGNFYFSGEPIDADTFVLMLPLESGSKTLAMLAFIGGLSASTGMVIVASITLSTMVCNDIIMPLLFRLSGRKLSDKKDLGALLLTVRRMTILSLMLMAYFYYRILGEQGPLSSFGLLAFAAAAQFLPAIVGGLFWKKGSRRGALTGMVMGFILWAYTLVLPTFMNAGILSPDFLTGTLFNYHWLAPTSLMGLNFNEPLSHGVFWSLMVNASLYVLISQYSPQRLVERIQASAFVDVYNKDLTEPSRQHGVVTVGDLQMLTERFLGLTRTQDAFAGYVAQRNEEPLLSGDKATPELILFTERLLAGVIGASSSRIVLASILRGREMQIGDVVSIVDEASQALRFNRSLLQSTIENIGLGISVVDQQLRLVAWNRPYIEMFSYPEGLICIGREIEEIFRYNAQKGEYGPGDVDEQVHRRLQSIKAGRPHGYERYRPDGTVLAVRGNPMPNGGYVNTYMDVTQQKQIEEALRESEQNIRIYTDNVPVLIAYLDTERRYLFVNKAYADAFGLDRHTIVGMPAYKVLSSEEYEKRRGFIQNVLEGKRQRFETILPSQQDIERFAEVTYIPHIGEYGDILGYFTLYQDITERREAELALQITNETLEQRVKERTHALSVVNKELRKENTIRALMEDELRQAKSDADAANLGKTRFLAAASHDLLQPLNASRLFASALAQQSHSSPATKELVSNLDGSLKAAEELITAILDISKLDAGALEPSISHFSLDTLFSNLSTEFTAVANDKDLAFHYVNCHKVVISDQKLLRRILQNFLSNAVRYTQSGKILLGCRRHKDMLRIEVWDTGVGIPKSRLNEVFEEFKRIDNPKHSQVQGLGLGLAITERIARMLGHRINVRSWVNAGTVFSVDVPLGDPQKAIQAKPEQRGWIRSKALNGTVTLVIDNEPKILEGMTALLQGWGCETYTALSINEATALYTTGDAPLPDIVLADYHLGETETGIMALEALYQLWGTNVPSMVITADRTEAVHAEIEAFGSQLLTKPIRPAGLRAMINKLRA